MRPWVLLAAMGISCAPNATHPVREEEVRGAMYVMRIAVDAAGAACMEISTNSITANRCLGDVLNAREAEPKAFDALEAWSHGAGPLKCALSAYAVPLIDAAQAIVDSGLPLPKELSAGVYYAGIIDRIEEQSSCTIDSGGA